MSSNPVWRCGRKLKRADYVQGWWMEAVLGEDDHGEWTFQAAHSPTLLNGGPTIRMPDPIIRCYPRDAWWVATFYGDDRDVHVTKSDGGRETVEGGSRIYVDISTPARRTESGISYIDLVLDVVTRYDGGVRILDEDELAEETARWSIPDGHLAAARASCEHVYERMLAGAPPFDGLAARWRERCG